MISKEGRYTGECLVCMVEGQLVDNSTLANIYN